MRKGKTRMPLLGLRVQSTVILVLFCSSFGFASLRDVEKKLEEKNTPQLTNQETKKEESKEGHYNTESKIIGSRNEYTSKKFTPDDFTDILELIALSRALETYHVLMKERNISPTGKVLINNLYVDERFNIEKGDIIKVANMATYYRGKFKGSDLIKLLSKQQILDTNGYVVSGNKFSKSFNADEFSFIGERLVSVSFGLKDQRIAGLIASDLYRFILNEINTIVVDKLETTSYESKKAGFFEGIFDAMSGNFMKNIFMQDKVSTIRSKGQWTVQFNPYEYYNVYYGLTDYLYQDGSPGWTTMYGKNSMNDFMLLVNKNTDVDQLLLEVSSKFTVKNSPIIYDVLFWERGGKYEEFRDKTDSFGFYALYMGGGTYYNHSMVDVDFGLSFKRGMQTNGIGIFLQAKGEWDVFNPVYLCGSWREYFQPNLKEKNNNWSFMEFNLGVGIALQSLSLEAGYLYNRVQESSWYGSLKMAF